MEINLKGYQMKVSNYPNEISSGKRTLVLGTFASIHNGHLKLILKAQTFKNKVIVMIIANPGELPASHKTNFESLDIRLQQLSNLDVDECVAVNFDLKIRNTTGDEFVKSLVDLYDVKKIVVGDDFAMGKNASFKAKDIAKKYDTEIVEVLKIGESKLSTKLLVEMVELGDVDLVKRNSPYHYMINTRISNKNIFKISGGITIPHPGIYSTWAIVNSIQYSSLTRVSKTGENEILIKDLNLSNTGYDAEIHFVKQIRSVIRKDFDLFNENDWTQSVKYLKNHL